MEGLILLKMYALTNLYPQAQWDKIFRYEADIAILWESTRPKMDALFQEIQPFVTDDQLAELTNIIADIQRKIERVDRAKESKP